MTTPSLEKEQEELLAALVEARRNTPRDRHHEFLFLRSHDGGSILHPGFPPTSSVYGGDLQILARIGLLIVMDVRSQNDFSFEITSQGMAYYEQMRQRRGEPVAQVESVIRTFLDSDDFQRRYPAAYEKWVAAERLLWGSDSTEQLTTIGHLCREAMQAFATALVERFQPPGVNENPQKDVARLRAVLELRKAQLPKTVHAFCDALLVYWGTVTDLVQRQEHGAQKEEEPLAWEDARRIVFQTAVVFFEVDRALR
jgi:hypothetical protein